MYGGTFNDPQHLCDKCITLMKKTCIYVGPAGTR